MIGKVLITGATGRTGRFVVEKLAVRGQPARLLLHKRIMLASKSNVLIRGDLGAIGTLREAVRGVSAIIAAHGSDSYPDKDGPERVDYGGVAHLLWVLAESEQPHFIYVSTLYATRPNNPLNRYGQGLDFKRRAEALIRASGLPYTIVRPGWLTESPSGQGVRFEQGDTGEGSISRERVAEVLVQALYSDAARGKTFEIFEDPLTAPSSWDKAFRSLEPDHM